ncbi:MAG: hypothetical protein ABRQ38_25785, partial [Candidatus Eremiobacterota bacterium]
AGFAGLGAGAAVVAGIFLSDLGPTAKFIGSVFGGAMAMMGSMIGSSMSENMLQSPSLLAHKACTRHHNLVISSFGVLGASAAVGIGGGLGGIVAGGIVGGVVGMIAASQTGWPEE